MSREGENKNQHSSANVIWFEYCHIERTQTHRHTHTSRALLMWIANKKQRERNRGQSATTRLCREKKKVSRKKNERTASVQRVCFSWRMRETERRQRQQFIIIAFIFPILARVLLSLFFFSRLSFMSIPLFSRRCSAHHPHPQSYAGASLAMSRLLSL